MARQALQDGRGALVALSAVPHVRTTRQISGLATLAPEDADTRRDDSIGCIVGEIAPHSHYEVPFGALVNAASSNVVTAGRSISALGAAREVTRLIAPCALTGQAAGTAASIAIERGSAIAEIPIDELQSRLEETGITIHR